MGDGEVGKKKKNFTQGKMSPNKFIQSETERKKIMERTGPLFH